MRVRQCLRWQEGYSASGTDSDEALATANAVSGSRNGAVAKRLIIVVYKLQVLSQHRVRTELVIKKNASSKPSLQKNI